MASIPIQNETDYTLTDDMTQQMIRDTHEHFGEEILRFGCSLALNCHALNARTRETRYALIFAPRTLVLGSSPCPRVEENVCHDVELTLQR